jgi:acetolactate synthase-1/2/3 large subunit
MRVADKIFSILSKHVDTVFFLPGGGAMHLVDALGQSSLNHVSCLHEQGAGFAAVGYAMARDGLGVCLTTSGPGATNSVTACAAAWTDSVPVLFISGQTKTSTLMNGTGLRSRGNQEVDIISMVKGITKVSKQVLTPQDAIETLEFMIKECLDGRFGPAWLDIPQDVQAMECAE